MPALREPLNLGDLLKYEEETLRYSRDRVTVAAGENLERGAVVGRVTASRLIKRLDPTANDGTEHAIGLILEPIDASLAERDDGLLLARHAIVAEHLARWPEGITTAQQTAAIDALELRGILLRQAA